MSAPLATVVPHCTVLQLLDFPPIPLHYHEVAGVTTRFRESRVPVERSRDFV